MKVISSSTADGITRHMCRIESADDIRIADGLSKGPWRIGDVVEIDADDSVITGGPYAIRS